MLFTQCVADLEKAEGVNPSATLQLKLNMTFRKASPHLNQWSIDVTNNQPDPPETVPPNGVEPERAASRWAILKSKPCPICGQAHGNSAWTVVNSSILRPRTCQACGGQFHQTGFLIWLIVFTFFPNNMLTALITELASLVVSDTFPFLIKTVAFSASVGVEVFLGTIYINRSRPLVPEQQYG